MTTRTKARMLALTTLLGAASVQAAIVVDGDFSTPSGGTTFTTFNAGDSFGPWSVNTGSVDLIGGYWQNPGGTGGSVDLDGNAPGSISQALTLAAGDYQLTFNLSGNPDGGDPLKGLAVSVGDKLGVTYSFTTGLGGQDKTNMNYLTETLNFHATGNTNLIFQSTDASGPYGAVIGNVSVTAVPEPATITMALLGLGAVAFIARRRRQDGSFEGAAA